MHEGSELARWERWENSEVARSDGWDGSEVASSERWDGSEVTKWERWEGRVVRWQSGRFLVLFEDGRRRVSPRFDLFVSDLNETKVQGVGKIFLHGRRDGKILLRSNASC